MKDILRNLEDPELNEKSKISSSDNFELVYMRHKYFRKSSNPSEDRLAQFEEMICNISDKVYCRNVKIFKTTGLEMEDLRNVGRVNTVSFISMCGLKENPKLMDNFVKDHKNKFGKNSTPTSRDVFLRECYNLSKYLNQRLHEVAHFCEIKNSNIIGSRVKKYFFVGPENKVIEEDALIREPVTYGYKKITKKRFEQLAKEFNSEKKDIFLIDEGRVARVVSTKLDLNSLNNFYLENCYNELSLDPEEILLERENLQQTIMKLEKKKRKSAKCKIKKALDLL